MSAWTDLEIRHLNYAVNSITNDGKWIHPDKYHRKNAPVWKQVKRIIPSIRDYRSIRKRYKTHHDEEIQVNANKVLTQQEERTLLKYASKSPGDTIRFKKGFEDATTRLKIPIDTAQKRSCANVCINARFRY